MEITFSSMFHSNLEDKELSNVLRKPTGAIHFSGFDKYFTNLRPPMRLSDCDNTFRNRKSGVNCRNPWFREFWSYHFRCRFPDEPNDPSKFEGQKVEECTGKEHLNKYEQEGLVPFVGKSNFNL